MHSRGIYRIITLIATLQVAMAQEKYIIKDSVMYIPAPKQYTVSERLNVSGQKLKESSQNILIGLMCQAVGTTMMILSPQAIITRTETKNGIPVTTVDDSNAKTLLILGGLGNAIGVGFQIGGIITIGEAGRKMQGYE